MPDTPIIIVLGHKLNRDGTCSDDFVERIRKGVELAQATPTSRLVITGGKTRKEFPSEADMALEHIKALVQKSDPLIGIQSKQQEGRVIEKFIYGLTSRVLLEPEARATSEHPRLVRALLRSKRITPSTITIVTSNYHLGRSIRTFTLHWPEISSKLRSVGVGTPKLKDRVKESLLRVLGLLDPYDRIIMPTLKRLFRNG
jgi:uncharacterized SAM-binding protein YcdF (DUF218 family)